MKVPKHNHSTETDRAKLITNEPFLLTCKYVINQSLSIPV